MESSVLDIIFFNLAANQGGLFFKMFPRKALNSILYCAVFIDEHMGREKRNVVKILLPH